MRERERERGRERERERERERRERERERERVCVCVTKRRVRRFFCFSESVLFSFVLGDGISVSYIFCLIVCLFV